MTYEHYIGAYVNRTFSTGQAFQSFQIVEDMTKKTLWTIDLTKKQCSKTSIDDFPLRCVPENATYIGKSYFGNKALYFDTWSFFMEDYLQTSGQYSVAIAMGDKGDECVPIGESFSGKSTAGGITQDIQSSGGYVNFEIGIAYPDYFFTLPDFCPQELSKVQQLLQQVKL